MASFVPVPPVTLHMSENLKVTNWEEYGMAREQNVCFLAQKSLPFLPNLREASATAATKASDGVTAQNLCSLMGTDIAKWFDESYALMLQMLPVDAGMKVQCEHLLNALQGKYQVSELFSASLPRDQLVVHIEEAQRVGAEQLLRRVCKDGVCNPFGGFFLAEIQGLPLPLQFFLVLLNIAEALPHWTSEEGKDKNTTINWFTQLLPLQDGGGNNWFSVMQSVAREAWGAQILPEWMDLEMAEERDVERMNQLRETLERVACSLEENVGSVDDFGAKHILWFSTRRGDIRLRELKASANTMSKFVLMWLKAEGPSAEITEWRRKGLDFGDVKSLVLEGSSNCAGPHPGAIFTNDVRESAQRLKDEMRDGEADEPKAKRFKTCAYALEFEEVEVRRGHAEVSAYMHAPFAERFGSKLCFQGTSGVNDKDLEHSFAAAMVTVGEAGVGAKMGSAAFPCFHSGGRRSNAIGVRHHP